MSVHLMPRSIYWATDVNPHYLDYLVTLRATRPYMRVAYTDAMDAATFPDRAVVRYGRLPECGRARSGRRGGLRNIWNALEDGGRAMILVPCGPGLYGSLDEVLGHFRRYTEKQLATWRASRIPSRAGAEIQPAGRAGLVAERPNPAAKNIWAGADSDAELVDADFSAAGSVASASAAFDHRDIAEGKRRGLGRQSRAGSGCDLVRDNVPEADLRRPEHVRRPRNVRRLLRFTKYETASRFSCSSLRSRSAILGCGATAWAITPSRARC